MYKLYGGSTCPACGPMRDWMRQEGIEFEYIDVYEMDEPPEGLKSVPAVPIEGGYLVGDQIKKYFMMEDSNEEG